MGYLSDNRLLNKTIRGTLRVGVEGGSLVLRNQAGVFRLESDVAVSHYVNAVNVLTMAELSADFSVPTGLMEGHTSDTGAGRTFTNTGFLDLDALTGGAGTLGAVIVTVTTGGIAKVTITAEMEVDTSGAIFDLSYRVSGATTLASTRNNSLSIQQSTASAGMRISQVHYETGLTPGSNVFELQARTSGGIAGLIRPELIVEPLP